MHHCIALMTRINCRNESLELKLTHSRNLTISKQDEKFSDWAVFIYTDAERKQKNINIKISQGM